MKKEILNEVDRIKSLMILETETILLKDVTYPNVKVESGIIQKDTVPKSLIDDLDTAANKAGVVVTITAAKSDHSSETTTGNLSRHSTGQAVDISIIDGIGSGGATNSQDGNIEFRKKGNKLKDELVNLGYTWNVESGNPKAVLWQTNIGGNHFNHLHVSNKSGMPGASGEDKSDKSPTDEKELLNKIMNTEIAGKKVKEILNVSEEEIEKLVIDYWKLLTDFMKSFEGIEKAK
jgi:D-alanyl-D-alanine dipeptidase